MAKLRVSSTMNLLHCSTDNIVEYIRQSFLFYKKLGFDAADFKMRFLDEMGEHWEADIETVRKYSEEIGIYSEICHLPFGVSTKSSKEEEEAFSVKMHQAIEGAKLLGVKHAVIHPNSITERVEEYDAAKCRDAVLKHLEPYVEHANKIGLSLAVELMRIVPKSFPAARFCHNPEELCDIADTLGIGVCWDFGHAHCNGIVQSEGLRYVGKRLKALHVSDSFVNGKDHLPPFTGTVDWADAMKGLKETGFEGLLNYEVNTKQQPAAVQESFAQYLIDVAGELNRMLE